MFYIKTRLGAGATIRTEITSENVFCVCPECGVEHAVDLVDILSTGGDLFSTAVYCPECSKERAQQLKHEK